MAKVRMTEEMKFLILKLKDTCSLGVISQEIHRPRSTIQSFIRKWNKTKKISTIKPPGRYKFIISRRIQRKIVSFIRKNKHGTLSEIKRKFNLHCSLPTISKILKENKIQCFKEKIKTKLSYKNIKDRLAFVEKYGGWNLNRWKKVIYSDEVSFELEKHYKNHIWRKRGEEIFTRYRPVYIKKYIKAFGCISHYGKSYLYFLDNQGWNSRTYSKLISDNWGTIKSMTIPNNDQNYYFLHASYILI